MLSTGKPLRILVMEDDPGQARLVQRALERAGYVVDLAPDGDKGLALHETGSYDVLIVDHQMPGKGGLDVLRALTARAVLPPTIMVTGHGDEAMAVVAMKLGASDYIIKDVEGHYLALLPAVIERVLHQYHLKEQKRQAEEALQKAYAELEMRVQERTAELQQANKQLQAEIAERKQAETALTRLSRQNTLILDAAGEGIYGLDREGKVTFVNPAAARMFGWEIEELLGQPLHELVHHTKSDGTPSPRETCPILASFRDGTIQRVTDDVFWRKDRTSFLVEYVSAPIHEHGEIVGTVVVFTDITRRKRMEQEMRRADRLALVGQLASGLAHEIGTPLNVIAGSAEFLRLELQEQGINPAELDTIIEQANRITRLMQQLLSFARAKEQPKEPLALPEALSKVLRLLKTRFQHEAITITTDIPEDLPLVWGAADQLEQVFLNVLVNAWHAMPEGGIVTIQAHALNEQYVQIQFRDAGIGMSATALAHAFEPFYSTKGEKGTGLGLAICKQIIDAHQGDIALDSAPGAGTMVSIKLLRADAVS